jgi:adenosine deaminase
MRDLADFIRFMPKAELHLHLEGTFEPEMMFALAARNRVQLSYDSVDELRRAYRFKNLQEFLDLYYQGMSVLLVERDFYELTWAYLVRAKAQNVVHAEVFFDPQGHTGRGVSFATAIGGIHRALVDGETKLGISFKLIMCFLRHLDEADAEKTLDEALKFRDWIWGVGLDSSEIGHPPAKFRRVFARAGTLGLRRVAHAGEEGPADYVRDTLDMLAVDRIDHGNRCLDDETIVNRLIERRMGLTVCPLSNLRLGVVKSMAAHPLPAMLRRGLLVTVNSDDPAYFGGYINDNFLALATSTDVTREEIRQLAENSFTASFLGEAEKRKWIARLAEFAQTA